MWSAKQTIVLKLLSKTARKENNFPVFCELKVKENWPKRNVKFLLAPCVRNTTARWCPLHFKKTFCQEEELSHVWQCHGDFFCDVLNEDMKWDTRLGELFGNWACTNLDRRLWQVELCSKFTTARPWNIIFFVEFFFQTCQLIAREGCSVSSNAWIQRGLAIVWATFHCRAVTICRRRKENLSKTNKINDLIMKSFCWR